MKLSAMTSPLSLPPFVFYTIYVLGHEQLQQRWVFPFIIFLEAVASLNQEDRSIR